MQIVKDIPPLPPRPIDGHKGIFGRVLIVGGNDGMLGAPSFAGQAALRTGSLPVVGRLAGGRLLLDLRAVPPEQDELIVAAVLAQARRGRPDGRPAG